MHPFASIETQTIISSAINAVRLIPTVKIHPLAIIEMRMIISSAIMHLAAYLTQTARTSSMHPFASIEMRTIIIFAMSAMRVIPMVRMLSHPSMFIHIANGYSMVMIIQYLATNRYSHAFAPDAITSSGNTAVMKITA